MTPPLADADKAGDGGTQRLVGLFVGGAGVIGLGVGGLVGLGVGDDGAKLTGVAA